MSLPFAKALRANIKDMSVLPEVGARRIVNHVGSVSKPDLEASSFWTAEGEQRNLIPFEDMHKQYSNNADESMHDHRAFAIIR